MALMEYWPNGKDIMVPVFYFEVVMVMLKDKKNTLQKMQCQ